MLKKYKVIPRQFKASFSDETTDSLRTSGWLSIPLRCRVVDNLRNSHKCTAYLSTSPNTGSIDAMFTTMSAKSPPIQVGSNDCKLIKLGTRTFTR